MEFANFKRKFELKDDCYDHIRYNKHMKIANQLKIPTFESVFGKKYEGVPMWKPINNLYKSEKLCETNPKLFARLAKFVNFKKPEKLKEKIEYNPDFPAVLRSLEAEEQENPIFLAKNAIYHEQSLAYQSGPVYIDTKSISKHEPSLHEALNDSTHRTVRVYFNGLAQDVPAEINCRLCHGKMIIRMRRQVYQDEIREYPAYRCLKKGCQTFRAIRKIIEPDLSQNRQFEQKNQYDPDFILNSLMEMPESKKNLYENENEGL
ncbi:unnamed protein product [Caenorhabditis angaria]|uniref:Uncharacterized protein n=1 Tax=Caenorhabditis angaria TaxID=860376 RepID=A0A9P1MZN6_9PELO|nr:unnamed protein product [Caenorhabditis angaria]